jgi:DNA-directed RNA polymerase specialized sigma24 family protein
MTPALKNEIAAVHLRLVAASKGIAPVTRRSAAQMVKDLRNWREWKLDGVVLPGLPRNIRRAMAPRKTAAPKKKDLKVKNVGQKKGRQTIKNVQHKLPDSEIQELLATNYGKCRAIAMAIIGRYRLAEDCVSECVASALEQVAEGRVSFASPEKFCAWLHTIIRYNARKVSSTVTYTRVGDFLPNKGILPSVGRKEESPEASDQSDPRWDEPLDEPDEDVVIDQFDNERERVWGRSKQLPNLAEQGY